MIGAAAELAWVVAVPHQGRGYAREAALAVRDRLRDAGVTGFSAYIHPDHTASAGGRPRARADAHRHRRGRRDPLDRRLRTVGPRRYRRGVRTVTQDAHRGAVPDRPADLVHADGALVRLAMSPPAALEPDALGERSDEGFDDAVRQLGEYFAGERTAFDLPLRPRGSDFELAVWHS